MATLVIVSCGKGKIWDENPTAGPTPAIDVYIGIPFKTYRNYAQKFSDRWLILSAKYGFIEPDFIISEAYDVTFQDPTTSPIGISVLKMQAQKKHLFEYDQIVVLGGSTYTSIVSNVFSEIGISIKKPLSGLTLGYAIKKIKNAVKQNSPIDC